MVTTMLGMNNQKETYQHSVRKGQEIKYEDFLWYYNTQ